MILSSVRVPHELTVIASEYNSGTIDLMLEYVSIGKHLLTPSIAIAALKFDLCEEVARDPIDLVELRVAAAEGAVIGVLGEPVTLAIGANRFLTDFTL